MAKIHGNSTYTEELADEICEAVSTSPKMLEDLCEENKHWPYAKTIYKWRLKYPDFGQKYAIAKQEQIEPLVSTILNKARDKSQDFYIDSEGKSQANTPHLGRLRLEIDAIKWFASKLAPKLYGDRSETNHGVTEGSLMQKLIDKL